MRGRCRDRDGITPEALAEYVRCYTPDAIHGNCEDYRAGATIDLEHAAADGDRLVECPLLVLWGRDSTVGRLYDVMDVWRRHGRDVRGQALPGRHFIAEECPDATFDGAAGVRFGRVVRYTLRASFRESPMRFIAINGKRSECDRPSGRRVPDGRLVAPTASASIRMT